MHRETIVEGTETTTHKKNQREQLTSALNLEDQTQKTFNVIPWTDQNSVPELGNETMN